MKTFMKFNKITRQGVSKVKPKAWFKSTFLYIDVGTSAFGPSCTEFVAQGIFSVSPQSCSPGGFREVHRSITDGQTHRQSDFLSSWSKLKSGYFFNLPFTMGKFVKGSLQGKLNKCTCVSICLSVRPSVRPS